jgi:hypothetical protein
MDRMLKQVLPALLIAAAGLAGGARAADPNATGAPKPAVNAPSAGIEAPCSLYGYTCPSGLACKVLRAPPAKIPPLDFIGYQCQVTSGQYATLPGQCPPGYVTSANGCKPGPKACADWVNPAWRWTTVTLPLTGSTGYRCPYMHSSMRG